MDGPQLMIVVVLPFLLLAVGVVAALFWIPEGPTPQVVEAAGIHGRWAGRLGLAGTWLGLSLLTFWCEAIVAFIAVHAVLFTLGQAAGSVALFVSVVVIEATPFVWAFVLIRRARRSQLGGEGGAEPKV